MAKRSAIHPKTCGGDFQLTIPVNWVISGKRNSLGILPNGHLLVVELVTKYGAPYCCVFEHKDFEEMASAHVIEWPASFVRQAAHKLGIEQFDGYDVDSYFRDPEEGGPAENNPDNGSASVISISSRRLAPKPVASNKKIRSIRAIELVLDSKRPD